MFVPARVRLGYAVRWGACLSVVFLSGGAGVPAQAQAPQAAWSVDRLDATLSSAQARERLDQSEIHRAELGWYYAVPPFLHLRQRWGWVTGFMQQSPDRGNPFGQFLLLRDPTSPAAQDPSPNHDTLYGATFLDLSVSPVVLSVPPIPGRYWSIALVDAWFYNFEYVGSRTTGQGGGRWLIVGPHWRGPTPAGVTRVIRAPTNSVNLYQRIWFRDAADLPAVRAIQDRIVIRPLAVFLNPTARPVLPDPARVLAAQPYAVKDPLQALALVNQYLVENPPPESDRALLGYLAPVGIGPGLSLPTDAAAQDRVREGVAQAQQTLSARAIEGGRIVNGWQMPETHAGRRGGADGVVRQALAQIRTIGLNVPEEAVYYTTTVDKQGAPLEAAKRYTLRFPKGALPPIDTARFGFWSLTMYDRERLLLVPNPADKYVVRPSDPLVFDADGSLTLLLQSEPPAQAALRANWLPTPASGRFALNLRVYLGGTSVLDGQYAPPPVVAEN